MRQPSPPTTPLSDLQPHLRDAGWAVVDPPNFSSLCGVDPTQFGALSPFWDDLPPDPHLRDGGRYRRRRHGCFVVDGDRVDAVAHRPHWQPVEYNALHGGIERWFDALDPSMVASPAWRPLLAGLGRIANDLRGARRWFVEAHAFRIDTADGIGRPTPEGAHRDGVDVVAVVLVGRHRIRGGETRVFDADGPHGVRFELHRPWSALLLDDARVIHETTPIQPLDAAGTGWRDTLVLTLRADGFQGPAEGGDR